MYIMLDVNAQILLKLAATRAMHSKIPPRLGNQMCQFAEAPLFVNPLDDVNQGSCQWTQHPPIVKDLLDQL